MASITKRNGKYRMRWYDLSGEQHHRTCLTKKSATTLAREVEGALELGKDWVPEALQAKIDLRDVVEAFLDAKVLTSRPGTVRKYRGYLETFTVFLEPKTRRNGLMDPGILSRRLLRSFTSHLLETGRYGRPRKKSTAIKYKEVVELLWQWAWGEREYRPHFPPPERLKMLRELPAETRAPTADQVRQLIGAWSKNSWQRRLAIVLAMTGLRVNQAMQLEWDDLNTTDGTLRIRPELGKSRRERSGRIVPLSAHLLNELATWPRLGEYVIHSNGKGQRNRLARSRDMARAWNRAGVPVEIWQRRPHHAFRKGFVTILSDEGASSDAVEQLVGHSLGLRGVYLEHRKDALRKAIDLLPNLIPSDH